MDRLRKYILLSLHLLSAITYVKCDGRIAILEKPSSMKLHGDEQILSSNFLESIEHMLGYQYEGVKQMEIMNVFDYDGLNVMVMRVDDPKFDSESSNAIRTYELKEDFSIEDLLNELRKTAVNKNSFGMNVRVDNVEDINSVNVDNESPRLMYVDLRSKTEPEITKIMADSMKLKQGLPNMVKIIISSDGKISKALDRQKRQDAAPAEESGDKKKEVVNAKTLNLADDYDEDFPVIFNIMLWFSIALIFALISICMVIANMDPGRDSIIYRMTSTRMKKDN